MPAAPSPGSRFALPRAWPDAVLPKHTRHFWVSHLLLPLILGLGLWLIYPATGIDLLVQSWYYDPLAQTFPLRHEPWLTVGMHSMLRMLCMALSLVVFAAWAISYLEPALRPARRRLGWIWVAMVLASSAVAALKSSSVHHCPWDLVDYGGYAPHLGLFQALPAGIQPGHCFPGGHASAGFTSLALYFGWRDERPHQARWALVGAVGLGFAMGWSQTMRGAHFLSHTLWSAWVVWLVLLLCYLVFPPQADQHLILRA